MKFHSKILSSLVVGIVLIVAFQVFAKTQKCFAAFQTCTHVEESAKIAEQYYWYTEQNFLAAAEANQKIVLFFYAPWCGTCSVLDAELIAHPDRLPKGITVLKIAYDREKILKAKYGIVTQHTLVYVDDKGKELKKWVGGDIARLVNELH